MRSARTRKLLSPLVVSNKCLPSLLSLIALIDLGCGAKVVDLGGTDGAIYSSGTPANTLPDASVSGGSQFRLVDGDQGVCASQYAIAASFTVVSGRLYWVTSRGTLYYGYDVFLRSCSVDDCGGTLMDSQSFALDEKSGVYCPSFEGGLLFDEDNAYWFAFLYPRAVLIKVKLSGEKGPVQRLPVFNSGKVLVSAGVFYMATEEGTVLRCSTLDCAGTLERFLMNTPVGQDPYHGISGGIIAKDEEYLYVWEGASNGSDRLLRVPLSLDSTFEVLAVASGADSLGTAKMYGDNIYWLESAEMGQLKACPKTGCVGSPAVLMSGLKSPSEVLVEDTSIYVLEPPQVDFNSSSTQSLRGPGRILKCPVTGCSEPQVMYTTTTEYRLTNLFVDDRFLYVAGNNCTYNADPHSGCGYIAVMAK